MEEVANIGASSNTSDQKPQNTEPPQKSLEERSKELLSEFDAKCTAEGVSVAVAMLIDPKTNKPIIYARGDVVDQAFAACDLAKRLKHKLMTSEPLSV